MGNMIHRSEKDQEMDKDYVSEFTAFMGHYLEEHPEVLEEQMHGYDFSFNRKIDREALDKANEDIAPDDHYGFTPLRCTPPEKPRDRICPTQSRLMYLHSSKTTASRY